MTEKYVIVHKSIIEEWRDRNEPPLPLAQINKALDRIRQIETEHPDDCINVEESVNTGFPDLPDKVGSGNTGILLGARAGYCLRVARESMEKAGITVVLDIRGCLP